MLRDLLLCLALLKNANVSAQKRQKQVDIRVTLGLAASCEELESPDSQKTTHEFTHVNEVYKDGSEIGSIEARLYRCPGDSFTMLISGYLGQLQVVNKQKFVFDLTDGSDCKVATMMGQNFAIKYSGTCSKAVESGPEPDLLEEGFNEDEEYLENEIDRSDENADEYRFEEVSFDDGSVAVVSSQPLPRPKLHGTLLDGYMRYLHNVVMGLRNQRESRFDQRDAMEEGYYFYEDVDEGTDGFDFAAILRPVADYIQAGREWMCEMFGFGCESSQGDLEAEALPLMFPIDESMVITSQDTVSLSNESEDTPVSEDDDEDQTWASWLTGEDYDVVSDQTWANWWCSSGVYVEQLDSWFDICEDEEPQQKQMRTNGDE